MKRAVWIGPFVMLCALVCACEKGERADAFVRALDARIKAALALGASRAEVEAFLKTLRVDGERVREQEYSSDLSRLDADPHAPAKPRSGSPQIKSYLAADFGRIDGDYRTMHGISVKAVFYFNEEQKLIEHLVHRNYSH